MRALVLATDRELVDQTPPNGDDSPYYFCPACGDESSYRGDMRAHLLACPEYRAFIAGSVRRRDLEEVKA